MSFLGDDRDSFFLPAYRPDLGGGDLIADVGERKGKKVTKLSHKLRKHIPCHRGLRFPETAYPD